MKAVLVSIKPKWVAKILNGEKTIEIRKTMPKCDLPIDVYIYCTKDNSNGYLYYSFKTIFHDKYVLIKEYDKRCIIGNSKVVAKFTLKKVERFEWNICGRDNDGYWLDNGERFELKPTCLTYEELFAYIKSGVGYAWHISNLEIFDKPKELIEFNKYGCEQYDNDVCETYGERGHLYTNCFFHLTKAPQSWCYVECKV